MYIDIEVNRIIRSLNQTILLLNIIEGWSIYCFLINFAHGSSQSQSKNNNFVQTQRAKYVYYWG